MGADPGGERFPNRTEQVTTTALAPRTRADTNAGLDLRVRNAPARRHEQGAQSSAKATVGLRGDRPDTRKRSVALPAVRSRTTTVPPLLCVREQSSGSGRHRELLGSESFKHEVRNDLQRHIECGFERHSLRGVVYSQRARPLAGVVASKHR